MEGDATGEVRGAVGVIGDGGRGRLSHLDGDELGELGVGPGDVVQVDAEASAEEAGAHLPAHNGKAVEPS